MNKNRLLLGAFSLAAIAGGFFIFNKEDLIKENSRTYYSSTLDVMSEKHSSWQGAKDYYELMHTNVNTGKVEAADYDLAFQKAKQLSQVKSGLFTFTEEGPDNIGGRTRAIIVDVNNDNIVYAGSVDGGVYKSTNGGNNWSRLDSWDDASIGIGTVSITSIATTSSGTIYVGTGGTLEGGVTYEGSGMQDGNGIWYSTDGGSNWTQLSGTSGQNINKIVAVPNQADKIYFVGQTMGLKECTNKGSITQVGSSISSALTLGDVKVSPTGSVIICGGVQGSYRTFVSNDGGSSFTDLHSTGVIPGAGISRMEYAISYETNSSGKYSLYAAQSTSASLMGGIYHSEDNGVTWYSIAPASTYDGTSTGAWAPCVSQNGQCNYDMVIDAVKGNPDQCVFGGIDLYKWTRTPGNDPSNGQWEQMTYWAYPRQHPRYVHADNHRITWNSQGRMYVGNDGGIQMSVDSSLNIFVDANRGYNVTQFYAMAYGPNWEVMGGAQDNGTNYNDHSSLYSDKEFANVRGGDGFECEISYINPDFILSSVYSASISRSEDKGQNWDAVEPPCGSATPGLDCATFYTSMRLFEDPNDVDTKDSIQFIPDSNMVAGDTAIYYSETFTTQLKFKLTQDLVVLYDSVFVQGDSVLPNFDTIYGPTWYYYNPQPQDTINLPDPIQSMFITSGESGVYMTRDIMRLTKGAPEWWEVLPYGSNGFMNSYSHSYEFSKDGNNVWIGSSNGELVRISGLDSAYSEEAMDYSNIPSDSIVNLTTGDTIVSNFHLVDYSADNYMNIDGTPVTYKLGIKKVSVSGMSSVISDISIDANDPDRVLVVTAGTGSSHVFYSSNATSANPTFTAIDGTGTTGLPDMPVFGVEFILNPAGDDIVLVGTEYGVYSTLNPAGASHAWTAHNEEIGLVPVFDVRQQWRDWNDGVFNPYAVYLGTHGKGIWKSEDVLSVDDRTIEDEKESISNINVYPNPMNDMGSVAFELNSNSDVEIQIFDLTGKIVKQKKLSNLTSGSQVVNFNASSLPTGTYLILVQTNGIKHVEKFVKY